MGLHKLTAGDGYTYLVRQVAAHDATEKAYSSLGDYYDQRGESPGRWLGAGLAGLGMAAGDPVTEEQMRSLFGQGRHPNAAVLERAALDAGHGPARARASGGLGRPFPVYDAAAPFRVEVARRFTAYNTDRGLAWNTAIPAAERARIRTEVATGMFTEQHGRPPVDARELSGFVARASRQATTAVAGYDLTFSPVKSVSTLWAIAPREIAARIEQAHAAAVDDTLGWLQREAAFTRVGRAGARQVPARGLVAAAFTHRDTRTGDPDLHTHLAVSNKVQTQDGRWLALDGRVLYKANVGASERYNTRLEAELTGRLGVRFVERAPDTGKRVVREIDGVDPLLARFWSSRRAAIETRRAELATQFQASHGRPPTAVEAIALAQQATLETRDAKHPPRSQADQRAQWRRQAGEVLGGDRAVDAMVNQALRRRPAPGCPDGTWVAATAETVVATLEASRASWQTWHVRAEAERQARAAGVGLADLDRAVDRVVAHCLTRLSVRLGAPDPITEPPPLRAPDGRSVYDVHGSASYTSARILDAEHRLLAAARSAGGRAVSAVRVGIAIAEAAANDTQLNDAQATLVRDLATSGARLQLGLAPAGTGKTTAMRVLARAWLDAGGYVVGLAPSAQAAQHLGQTIDGHTDTLTKLTWTLTAAPRDQWPEWVDRIGPRTLVIIDEAGQAGTAELAAAVDYITGRGGSVRLIGDDRQLASVAAGGILRDIAHTVGAATLSEVRRFTDPAEAAATLAVRDGDPAALGFYADNARVHVGDIGTVADHAYRAWTADRAAGRDAILLAPTRHLVTRLNERARLDRLATTPAGGPEDELADGTRASTGDTIVTRRNDRRLTITASDWVRNGDRWTVEAVHPAGGIRARHLARGTTVVLPPEYVSQHVQLGYAATVHSAQGITTDTAHTVVAGDEPRQLLYVALSRGRAANHLYLADAHDGDPHSLIRPETLIPPTAIDVLTTILGRDGSHTSASTTRRDLDSPATQLHQAALRYHDALGYAAEYTLGADTLTALDRQVEALLPGLTGQPAYPTLRAHIALRALDGADPLDTLLEAADSRELGTADDPAAVVDWRIGAARTQGPLPWLPPIPARLAAAPDWGGYLQARAARVAALAGQLHAAAAAWTPGDTPDWAHQLTDADHAALRGDLAVWRAAFAVPATDHRPTGPRQPAADAARHQRTLDQRTQPATGATDPHGHGWALPEQVSIDPQARRLRQRLDALDRAGIDTAELVATALSQPRPLPAELPADALWWRIVGRLGPAALRATATSAATLRPAWTTALVEHLGQQAADRVFADPAWPALVAAVHAAPPEEWTPQQLIGTAVDGLQQPGPSLPAEELCPALVWRVAVLTDGPPQPPDAAEPTDNEPTDPRDDAPGAPTATPVDRIVELNRQALDYYTSLYPRSWAPGYLRDRLGTDLTDHPEYPVGYAPPGPTSLIRHLAQHGAAEHELLEAGLARRTDNGRLVDTFRDRAVFPIHHGPDLVGFIARRNPTKDDAEYGGPKYLNTRTTAAFVKGEQLYGLAEGAAALADNAVPVLVEGPLDAIAVSIAAPGRTVGIAPLGTAFTPAQADQLRAYFRGDPSRIVVATDADTAGWTSAQRAYWQLTRHGADPQHLALPDGTDPADLLRARGAAALRDALTATRPLADTLTGAILAAHPDSPDSPATRLRVVQKTGQVIGALPPDRWLPHIQRLTDQLGLPVGMLHMEVADTGHAWTDDAERLAAQRIAEINQPRPTAWPGGRTIADQQLRALVEQHQPQLTGSSHWQPLAAALTHAHATGHDLPQLLRRLLSQPLPAGDNAAAVELRYRLSAATDLGTADQPIFTPPQAHQQSPGCADSPGPPQHTHSPAPGRGR